MKYEKEATAFREKSARESQQLAELQSKVTRQEDLYGNLEEETANLDKHKGEMDTLRRTSARLRKQARPILLFFSFSLGSMTTRTMDTDTRQRAIFDTILRPFRGPVRET